MEDWAPKNNTRGSLTANGMTEYNFNGNPEPTDDLQLSPSSAMPQSPTAAVRSSPQQQRMSKACFQCHRQKQKCSKDQPCTNCVRRRIPHLCSYTWVSERRHRHMQSIPHAHSQSSSSLHSVFPAPVRRQSSSGSTPISNVRSQHQYLGRLFKARGAASYHGDSYFGHQSAAAIVEAATLEIPGGTYSRNQLGATQAFRSERGPYAQLWELIGSLPRQKAIVDNLTQRFFKELNPTFDSVHEETFQIHYDKFWDRKYGRDDLTNVDIRWLSVLFIILAFGELLECPQNCSAERQREAEDSSLHFYWAARKSLVIAPSFYGESTDLTRSGILITRYLIFARRVSESWLTVSFAVRMAQAQGMHIDGGLLDLPRKVVETRRRLWSQLYNLDRSIALALGRPYAINDAHCAVREIENIWVDNMSNEEAVHAKPKSMDDPTPSILIRFQHHLANILGKIQERSLGYHSVAFDSVASYDEVLKLDEELLAWKDKLPPYFRLDNPDLSLDGSPSYLFIPWHRLYLHTAYHFARITLHRSYLLRPSITDRFQYSRDACMSSACADLKIKLGFRNLTMANRIMANVAFHQLFNSALILGIIVVRDPHSPQAEALLDDLQAYCDKQNSDNWVNEMGLAEVRVVELCITRARQARRMAMNNYRGEMITPQTVSERDFNTAPQSAMNNNDAVMTQPSDMMGMPMSFGIPSQGGFDGSWTDLWSGSNYFFPEPTDFQIWEGLVDDLAAAN